VYVRVFGRVMQVAAHQWYSCTSHITELTSSVAVEPWTERASDAVSVTFVVLFICRVDP
jgi:hypothetical protein